MAPSPGPTRTVFFIHVAFLETRRGRLVAIHDFPKIESTAQHPNHMRPWLSTMLHECLVVTPGIKQPVGEDGESAGIQRPSGSRRS
jgi:hypothetical protein